MGETNQCDGCQRGLPVDTQGTHYDPAEAGVDAWSRYRIGCTRQRYAEPDPRDAEIARLREEVDRVTQTAVTLVTRSACAEHAAHVRTLSFDEFTSQEEGQCWRCLRAQLAAAQADAVALRGALELVKNAAGSHTIARDEPPRPGGYGQIYRTAAAALATPTHGAPLLDAVRDMCADLDMLLGVLTYNSKTDPPRAFVPKAHGATFAYYIASLSKSLAAVRAVLSRAQDSAPPTRRARWGTRRWGDDAPERSARRARFHGRT